MAGSDDVVAISQKIQSQQGTQLWDGYVNMLKILSSIFLSPTHWVLEFLQNAEDAKAKTFAVYICQDHLWCLNDGNTFSTNELCSICDCRSYKLPSLGFRGYLGVGFKSIFRITDRVYIHSGEYHFKFDRGAWADKPITQWPWEILPIPVHPQEPQTMPSDFKTGFYVPLNTSKGQGVLGEIRKFFEIAFPKEALLQLRHVGKVHVRTPSVEYQLTKEILRGWEIVPGVLMEQVAVKKEKRTASGFLPDSQERYLIVRKEVKIPEDVKADETTARVRRSNIDSREVGLVLGLDDKGMPKILAGKVSGVYSFLPVESEQTGLPFGIFGDLIPQPGRDLIDYSARWNRWICTEILELFKTVIQSQVWTREEWMAVPLEMLKGIRDTAGPGESFWRETLRVPVQQFLTSESLYRDRLGRLKALNQLVVADDEIVQAVGAEHLEKALGRFLPHPQIAQLMKGSAYAYSIDIDVYDLIRDNSFMASLKSEPRRLASLYRLIARLSDYYINGRQRRDTPLAFVPFVLGADGELRPPCECVIAYFEAMEKVPEFLKGLVERLRNEAQRRAESKRPIHPDIVNDEEAYIQLLRCGVEQINVGMAELANLVKVTLNKITGPEQCPQGWRFPDHLIEATLFLLSFDPSSTLSIFVAEDGAIAGPGSLFVPGAPLDWEPLWKAGYLPQYKPVHNRYLDQALLSQYRLNLNEDAVKRFFESSGLHGFNPERDRVLTEIAAYSVAKERLEREGHILERTTDAQGAGYDYKCSHCEMVFEVKGMGSPKDITLTPAESKAAIERRANYILVCIYNLPSHPDHVKYRMLSDPYSVGESFSQIKVPTDKWLSPA
ncbi:MAG: DUF3883 domain-containing protein [Nitrososphaerota archaeon]